MRNMFSHTYLRCGGKYYAVLLEIFILYSAVKELWKLAKIWESYCQKFGGFLFGTQCIFAIVYFCVLFAYC